MICERFSDYWPFCMAQTRAGQWTGPATLYWHHNEHHGVSNHRRLDCLFDYLLRLSSKKTSKLTLLAFFTASHSSIWWDWWVGRLFWCQAITWTNHYSEVTMSTMASQITGILTVCSIVTNFLRKPFPWQAITWTSDDQVLWRHRSSVGSKVDSHVIADYLLD